MMSLVADSDEAAPRDVAALEVKPQLGMEMAGDFGPRLAAHGFVAKDDPGDLDLVRDPAAAMVGEAGIVVADDPRPVERARSARSAARGRRPGSRSQPKRSWKLSPRQIEARRAGRSTSAASALRVACES